MPFIALRNDIESVRLAAELGVVSTPRAFDEALFSLPSVRELADGVSRGWYSQATEARALELLRVAHDGAYCHPHDLPVAVYLRVLDLYAPLRAHRVAAAAAEYENTWWTRAMTRRTLAHANRKNAVASNELAQVVHSEGITVIMVASRAHNSPPRDIIATGGRRDCVFIGTSRDSADAELLARAHLANIQIGRATAGANSD